jgi:hypothetical protein
VRQSLAAAQPEADNDKPADDIPPKADIAPF